TMTSPRISSFVTWLFLSHATDLKLSSTVRHERGFVSANVGDNITLPCYTIDDPAWLYWYKQILGQKPTLISSVYVYETKATFYQEFKNNPRFTLDTGNGQNHLTVFDVDISDSATYYCASSTLLVLTFAEGIVVSEDPLFLVYFLSGALLFAAILVVLLGFSVYKVNKKNSCQYSESHGRLSAPPTANTEGYENADSPHYAAFSINPPNETRRQRNNTNVECVYSGVKQ
uniref:Ig-like domain-containing protein n=1 Tax=Cyclopterus lumpus TaxID=8103 RepID=A0A8C2ZDL4_CYCLU